MIVSTKHRSTEIEIMDDLDMKGADLISSLDQLAIINKWLGGNAITIAGIKNLLLTQPKDRIIRILDLGCGSGDMLRIVADYGRDNGYRFELIGIDANKTTIDYAIHLSQEYPEISYQQQDVLSKEFASLNYGIAMCTLFLHHFEDEVVIDLMQTLVNNASIGVLVNDLHRHKLAYYAFRIGTSFIKNSMTKQDGLTSILRAFKRNDLEKYAAELAYESNITWRWAFRFQWIIKKT